MCLRSATVCSHELSDSSLLGCQVHLCGIFTYLRKPLCCLEKKTTAWVAGLFLVENLSLTGVASLSLSQIIIFKYFSLLEFTSSYITEIFMANLTCAPCLDMCWILSSTLKFKKKSITEPGKPIPSTHLSLSKFRKVFLYSVLFYPLHWFNSI